VVTPDFYKVFFRDMEIGELNAEELRFRAARRVFELADERIGLLASTEDHAWERSPDTGRLERSRCGGGRVRVRLNRPLSLAG
jgi:hypothetical protein